MKQASNQATLFMTFTILICVAFVGAVLILSGVSLD